MKKFIDILKREQTTEFTNVEVIGLVAGVIMFGAMFFGAVEMLTPIVKDLYLEWSITH
tara:strand:- start:5269 stop:5442 length:174 start_codon:yes stop_codon:yes gene_type:complete